LRRDFTQKTISTLRKRAGEMCTICKRLTSIPHTDPEKSINLGEAAHIIGKINTPNKRFDHILTDDEISNISNSIWLCRECHKKIDTDELYFTVQYLKDIKKQHEADLTSGKLNYTKFIEYQKLEFEVHYLRQELDNKSNFKLIEKLEKEKQQFKEKIDDIEKTLLNSVNSLDKARKCFFELNDLEATLDLIDEDSLIKEEITIAQKRLLTAQVKEAQGKNDEAEINYKKSIDIYPYLENLFYYGKFLYSNVQYTDAIKLFKRIVGPENDKYVKKTKLNYDSIHILNRTCLFLAYIFQYLNDESSAVQYINNALSFQKYLIDKNPKEIDFHINTLSVQGILLNKKGQYREALRFHKKALELTEIIFDKNSHEIASCLANLGITYFDLNDKENAQKNLIQALNILEGIKYKEERNKSSLAQLYLWLFRLTNDEIYCNKSYNLYLELSEYNPKKYLRDKIISQIDIAAITNNLEEKESLYENILSQENDLINIDKNLYEPLLANIYRIFSIDLINHDKLEKALFMINKSIKLFIIIAKRNPNHSQDFITAINLQIDLLLQDKTKNKTEIENSINLFRDVMHNNPSASKIFSEVFENRLNYLLSQIN
jgi:tetratricopeptide (TPR) repeat protein